MSVVATGSFGMENDKSTNERHRNEQGLGWIITSLFVVGDLAGGGIVALPAAIVQTSKFAQMQTVKYFKIKLLGNYFCKVLL